MIVQKLVFYNLMFASSVILIACTDIEYVSQRKNYQVATVQQVPVSDSSLMTQADQPAPVPTYTRSELSISSINSDKPGVKQLGSVYIGNNFINSDSNNKAMIVDLTYEDKAYKASLPLYTTPDTNTGFAVTMDHQKALFAGIQIQMKIPSFLEGH